MYRTLLVVGLVLGLAAAPALAQQAPRQEATQPATAEAGRIVLTVDGLSCPLCAYGLQKKLEAIEATQRIDVKLNEGRVYLELRPGKTISDEVLTRTVKDAGFNLRAIERIPAAGSMR